MNSRKVIMAQQKYLNVTWLTDFGGGAGHVWFKETMQNLVQGKDLNALLENGV